MYRCTGRTRVYGETGRYRNFDSRFFGSESNVNTVDTDITEQ